MLCLCAARNHTEALKMLDELLFHARTLLTDCPSYFIGHITLFSALPFFCYTNNVAGKDAVSNPVSELLNSFFEYLFMERTLKFSIFFR